MIVLKFSGLKQGFIPLIANNTKRAYEFPVVVYNHAGKGKIGKHQGEGGGNGLDYWKYAKYINFALSFGTTMAVSLLLGFFGGRWLDRKLGTEPVFLVIGILAGTALAFYSMIKELQALEKTGGPKDSHKDE